MLFYQDTQCFLFIPRQMDEIMEIFRSGVLSIRLRNQGLIGANEFMNSRPRSL